MATTHSQHLADLLGQHGGRPDAKLTGDLVKYFIDIFGSPKPVPDQAPLLPSLNLSPGAPIKQEQNATSGEVTMCDVTSPLCDVKSPLRDVTSPLRDVTSPGSPVILSPSDPRITQQSGHGTKQIFEEPSLEVVKYVMGKRGGCQIVWKGHRYTRDRTRNDQTYWACVLKRPPYRCKGRISTKRSFVTSATAHNHTHQTSKSQTARLIHQLKQRVQDVQGCGADAADIVLRCLKDFKFNDTSSSTEELPSFETLVKMCKRIAKNKKKMEDVSLTMNSNYSQKLFNKSQVLLPGQFDFLMNRSDVRPSGCNNNNNCRTTLTDSTQQLNVSFANSTQQFRNTIMNSNQQLINSLANSTQQLRNKLTDSPMLLNRLIPGNIPSCGSGYSMVPMSTFLPAPFSSPTATKPLACQSFADSPTSSPSCSTASPIINSTAATYTPTAATYTPTAAAYTPTVNLRIASAITLSPVDVTSLDDDTDVMEAEDTTSADELMTSPDELMTCSDHESMLQRGVSSITEIRSYLDEVEQQYRARVSEIRVIEEDFKLCKEDVRSKDDRIKTLQREVSKLDVALKVAQEGLQKVRNTSEDKVERSLIKTFFTQYLTAPDTRKPEVLRLMTSILNYSEEELEHLQRSKDKKWLTQLFKPVQNSTELPPGESFSELFVSFLETEANRGTILGSSRPASTPPLQPTHQPTHQRSPSAASNPQQRSPSSASNHKRSSSSASSKSLPVGGTIEVVSFPNTPSAISGAQSTPLVVPASLADLLVSKPR